MRGEKVFARKWFCPPNLLRSEASHCTGQTCDRARREFSLFGGIAKVGVIRGKFIQRLPEQFSRLREELLGQRFLYCILVRSDCGVLHINFKVYAYII